MYRPGDWCGDWLVQKSRETNLSANIVAEEETSSKLYPSLLSGVKPQHGGTTEGVVTVVAGSLPPDLALSAAGGGDDGTETGEWGCSRAEGEVVDTCDRGTEGVGHAAEAASVVKDDAGEGDATKIGPGGGSGG